MSANARADCPTPTYDPGSGRTEVAVAPGAQSTIAANGDSKFVLAWQTPDVGHVEIKAVRLNETLSCIGTPLLLIAPRPQPPYPSPFGCEMCLNPSLTMNAAGSALLAFTSTDARCTYTCGEPIGLEFLRLMPFTFEPFAPGTVDPITRPSNECAGPSEQEPSTAIDAAGCASVVWAKGNAEPKGLDILSCSGGPELIRACGGSNWCFVNRWQPCAAAANGFVAVVWADAEDSADLNTPMNIKLRVYDTTGHPVCNEVLVNQPAESSEPEDRLEQPDSSQESPAVAFDSVGRIVVVWTGPPLNACTDADFNRYVFARRFTWNFVDDPQPIEDEFIVQRDDSVNSTTGRPTVAFSQKPGQEGRFVVVWNATLPGLGADQVFARVFDWQTLAMGTHFRVNLVDVLATRLLGNSAQHTAVWTASGTIAVTWTRNYEDVNVTLLPDGYAESLCGQLACCRGDLDGDGLVNGEDIQYWVKYLANPPGTIGGDCRSIDAVPCELDLNGDCRFIPTGGVPGSDWGPFVCVLLTIPGCGSCVGLAPSTCCSSGAAPAQSATPSAGPHASAFGDDCNQNAVPDAADIADGTSMDCNGNGRPDECDVGFDPRVTDFNYNLVPDECEADVRPPAASFGADLDRAAIAAAMDQWWAGFDYSGLKAWKIAYEIKMKFAELGFDLRTTVTEGGAQP